MIFSLYRILLGVLILIGISGFLTLTSSEYGPTLRGHITSFNPFPGSGTLDYASQNQNFDQELKEVPTFAETQQSDWNQTPPPIPNDNDYALPPSDHSHSSNPQSDANSIPTFPEHADDAARPVDTDNTMGWGADNDDDYSSNPTLDDLDETLNTFPAQDSYPQEDGYPTKSASGDNMIPAEAAFADGPDDVPLPQGELEAIEENAPAVDPNTGVTLEPWQAAELEQLDEEGSPMAEDPTDVTSESTTLSEPRYIFAFGDSLTALGFSMEGELPSHGNPFGNPPFPGHTSAGGPNWLDDLVIASPEDTLCYNFATGAAVVDVKIVHPMLSLIPFPYQVVNFTSKLATDPHPSFANWTAENSLAIVWLGVNDVSSMQIFTNQDTPTNLTNRIMVSFFENIAELYNAGLRRFLFMGVPPLTRFPFSMEDDGSPYAHYDNLTYSCKYWNEALETGTQEFKNAHPDAKADVVLVDPWFNEVIDAPTDFGALNATCKAEDGTSCLWVDGLHPGVEIARKVGHGVQKFISESGFYDDE